MQACWLPNTGTVFNPRSKISIEHFVQENGGEDFFNGFLGFVHDEEMIKKANQLLKEGFNAPKNLLDALAMLRECFFHDLYLYYDYNKDLKMFSAELFKIHESTFRKWMDYCKLRVQEISSESQSAITSTSAQQRTVVVNPDSAELGIKMDLNSAKLDRLIYLLETGKEVPRNETRQCSGKATQKSAVQPQSDKFSTFKLQSVRALRGDRPVWLPERLTLSCT